ncbi:hypothetical protein CLV92_104135 [Kineococcus xinjiangensis]|uniref:Uncharacterized protein n=2 Tax=Kineococcus xinjiangensis TaxID=512762 RepID=A0A2S6IT45_9ACTN|nr:hypothetical protein CLV92_104135 [Kineococcus xinjiangensis]
MSFRKPSGAGVLLALCAAAPHTGPVVAYCPETESVAVVHPGRQPAELRRRWPW